MILTRDDFREKDFETSWLGYRTDYPGVGVYVFKNNMNGKWYVMTLQGEGLRTVLPKDGIVASAYTP